MKWTYAIPAKLKASLVLTGVIGIILVNNLTERSQTRELKTAFESIYEDRLIAESYILQLSDELRSIQHILESNPDKNENQLNSHWQNMEQINLNYLETQLTTEEKAHFDAFEKITWNMSLGIKERKNVNPQIEAAFGELKILSQIQVKEAEALVSKTGRIFSSDAAHAQLEIALLIIAALVVQAILFASKTLSSAPKAPSQLN
ncbi:chemoreceptor-like protein with four helix bundle sensory module [Algoriphagus aquaeductus]|uniref:Chemoreceptor-like protein with four helix bundle sensory module n=1 Tax=Algoriphagus aquaeductus TaxID=475299 RepID=A0A326RM59_9BACT|nr:MCP four helix bundle domain-containing protein [Algoriphagus aquaeductus]PZV79672.1 chemoreceptor-like protein with four helix bundle sensory module [Algoriphagus aquaeductus]